MVAVKRNAPDARDLAEVLPLFARLRPGVTPNWSTRYRIGVILSKHLDAQCTLVELGRGARCVRRVQAGLDNRA